MSSVEKASKSFADFHEEPPSGGRMIGIPTPPTVVWELGRILSIAYEAKIDGKVISYEHEFRKGSAPHIAVSADGKALFFAGGKYLVTDRGIEDI